MKAKVFITRGESKETFKGTIIGETETFYKVTHETNTEVGEWLPKNSQNIKTIPYLTD